MNATQSARTETRRDQRLLEGVVGATPLLRAATPAQVSAVARHAWMQGVRRNGLVFAKGATLPGVFCVMYGSVKLALRAASDERVLRLVGAGQAFAEASALLALPAPYEASALVESKVAVIPAAAIFEHIDRDPRSARAAIAALAARNLEGLRELEAATLQDSAQRLAAYLVSLGGATASLRLPASKTTVAARLGMKKETLSRLLGRFAALGWIEVRGRELVLLDEDALARATL
jgi:CRP/FNR family transcriptional regulator